MTFEEDIRNALTTRDNEIERLRAEVERLRAALTPSAETKVAYWGEFHFTEETVDDEGVPYYRKIAVPWATIKEIMAAILARADLAQEPSNDIHQPLGGWAPGSYWHIACKRCGKDFEGDKRAWHCEPCSTAIVVERT
jgi:hypothetical protein